MTSYHLEKEELPWAKYILKIIRCIREQRRNGGFANQTDFSIPELVSTQEHNKSCPNYQNVPTRSHKTIYYPQNEGRKGVKKIRGTKINFSPDHDHIIGRGATSIVYKGFFNEPSCSIAVKCVKRQDYQVFQNELDIWKAIGYPHQTSKANVNIVGLHDWHELRNEYYFVMEMAKTNLAQRLQEIPTPDTSLLIDFCQDCARGLQWLHKQDIIHRDIKPENILIFEYPHDERQVAKLADFGVSRKITCGLSGTNTVGQGTEMWMPPEAIKARHGQEEFKNRQSLDIFSLGVTCQFALSRGEHPFHESERHSKDVISNIKDDQVLPSQFQSDSKSFTACANDLLQWMMQKHHENRPTIFQVLKHPLFWKWRGCIKFIMDVARSSYCKKDPQLNAFWVKVDHAFRQHSTNIQDSEASSSLEEATKFNWKNYIHPTILERKSHGQKGYDEKSLRSLVELMRDKYEHNDDMVDNLRDDSFFGDSTKNRHFCKEKYAEYFLERFPDIVIVLFYAIAKFGQDIPQMDLLRDQYHLEEFAQLNWHSKSIEQFFSFWYLEVSESPSQDEAQQQDTPKKAKRKRNKKKNLNFQGALKPINDDFPIECRLKSHV